MISYNIYPSLLDKFTAYQDYETEAMKPWNRYRTSEEVMDELKVSLLNMINKIPFSSEAIDRGTTFNAIIDCIIHDEPHKTTEREPFVIEEYEDVNLIDVTYPADPNKFFTFDWKWCHDTAKYFNGAKSQVFVQAILPTRYGDVNLYGVVDEIIGKHVYDIKTTGRYSLGKFRDHWQRHVYPYCLVESGVEVESFEYSAFEMKGNTMIKGAQFPEYYPYNHEKTTGLLIRQVEGLIIFLEENRELITDKKIFNQK